MSLPRVRGGETTVSLQGRFDIRIAGTWAHAMTLTRAQAMREGDGAAAGCRASIRVYPDGPLLVRGSFSITDEQGREIEVVRKTVSLCRCGRSGLAPLCDGSHAKGSGAAVPD